MLTSTTITLNDSTPTLLVDGPEIGEYIVSLRATESIIIGDSGVSTSSGLLLTPMSTNSEMFTAQMQGESLYGVAVSGVVAVGVLIYSA